MLFFALAKTVVSWEMWLSYDCQKMVSNGSAHNTGACGVSLFVLLVCEDRRTTHFIFLF